MRRILIVAILPWLFGADWVYTATGPRKITQPTIENGHTYWRFAGDTPDDPPDDPPKPPGDPTLKGKVAAAVRLANDAANASQLRDLWATADSVLNLGASMRQVVTLLRAGQRAQLDTVQEKQRWSAFLVIADEVFASPTAAKVKAVAAGLAESAGTLNAPWLDVWQQQGTKHAQRKATQ